LELPIVLHGVCIVTEKCTSHEKVSISSCHSVSGILVRWPSFIHSSAIQSWQGRFWWPLPDAYFCKCWGPRRCVFR